MKHYEDITVGTRQSFGRYEVTRDAVIEFASKFDPQPFHLDDDAARSSLFGGLAASGWHTCAMVMGLMARNFLLQSSSLGSPGLEKLKWLRPVYPGDTLTVRQRIVESRPMASRPDVGLVRSVWEAFNQDGEQVLMMDGYGMFRRRTPGEAASMAARSPAD